MRLRCVIFLLILMISSLSSCKNEEKSTVINIIYLHHSTGGIIWKGAESSRISKIAGKISSRLANIISKKAKLPMLFEEYNEMHGSNYHIKEMVFPQASPYGWNNFPFDYYNIWVKNAGNKPYKKEPTLEMLTKKFKIIIFKHCFPVSNIQADLDLPDINSDIKTISNYKLQYSALREKLHEFPDTKFILFTGAAQVESKIKKEEAARAKEFFGWVVNEWDLPDDNIYLWDFYNLETEGGLYFKDEYAVSLNNSHPNEVFAGKVVKLLFSRIIDVIENNGSNTMLSGELKR